MNTATPLLLMPTAADPVETKEATLAVIPKAKALEAFLEGKGIDELLAACAEKALTVTTDASTAKGRAEIKSMAYLVTRTKTAAEEIRKALADEYKEKPKRIDANGKRLRDGLDALQKRVREPLTKWEDAEKARIEKHMSGIRAISIRKECGDLDLAELSKNIEWLEGLSVDERWEEFAAEAQSAKDGALAKLYAAKDMALKYEAEQAELKRLREEQAKREQEEREASIAQEAAEKATRDAEDKAAREKAESEARELRARLAQEHAEREAAKAKADAEARAHAAVEAEKKRVAEAEAKAKAEEEARIQDAQHRFLIHSEILDDLLSLGLAGTQATMILDAIRDGQIRHLKIEY